MELREKGRKSSEKKEKNGKDEKTKQLVEKAK